MKLPIDDIHPEKGLGEELFLQISSLVPIVNVDLLVYNDKGQFLLTKRDDPHCGKGWHIPGGCIRFKETCEERIRKVAQKELGISQLSIEKEPIKVFEIIEHEHRPIENQNERAHFITLVYKCHVNDAYVINNGNLTEEDAGFIKWFDTLPDNLLNIQNCYREILK
jgi:colanic acid biosynthesis protein WcaH